MNFTYYPDYKDPNFHTKLLRKREIWENRFQQDALNFEDNLQLAPQQKMLAQYFNPNTPYQDLLVYHGVGVGKCHGKDTLILLYNGNSVYVQDVREGDLLLGDDGKPRKVLSLARGQDDMFLIEPDDPTFEPFTANKEHILCLYDTINNVISEIAIKDFLALSEERRHSFRAYKNSINFQFKDQEENPYDYGYKIRERGFHYIPSRYKTGTRLQRQNLLNGIVDSYPLNLKTTNSGTVYIVEDNPMLVNDILFVSRSLGYPSYKGNNGVYIILEEKNHQFSEFSIKPLGRGDYYGFVIDQNHRYLLNDFTVTHNTLTSIQIAEQHRNVYNIVVLVKNQTIAENYKIALRQYYSEIKQEPLNKHSYEFITFGVLKEEPLNNTLLIVDEAHNITGNNTDILLRKIKKKSNNLKMLLLTATPIFDSVVEIFQMCDLLNDPSRWILKEAKIDLIKRELYANGFITFTGDTPKLTNKAYDTLRPLLKGKVSYLGIDYNSPLYPTIKEQGQIISPMQKLLLVPCYMQGVQRQIYLDALNTENRGGADNYSITLKASEIVYPDGTLNGYKRFNLGKYYTGENLREYAVKFYNIVQNIKNNPGTHFIFSELVQERGLALLQRVLGANNISFTMLSGDITSTKDRFERIKYFNSPDNKEGNKLKVLIGSLVISEGISFKNVRNVHILEPYWNLSRLEQIIGRASRFGSHNDLPLKDRYVKVFKYVALVQGDRPEVSREFEKYYLAEEKDLAVKDADRFLKELAFDCDLNKTRNFLKSDYTNTRNCDYRQCNWTCPPAILPQTDSDLDNSTFYGEDVEVNQALRFIKNLFKSKKVYTISEILEFISKATNLRLKVSNIYVALQKITSLPDFHNYSNLIIKSDKTNRRDIYKEISKLVEKEPIIIGKTGKKSPQIPKRLSEENKQKTSPIIKPLSVFIPKRLSEENKQKTPPKASPRKTSPIIKPLSVFIPKRLSEENKQKTPPKASPRKTSSSTKGKQTRYSRMLTKGAEKGLYGTRRDKAGVRDGAFRIISNIPSAPTTDLRKVYTGKKCTSFSLDELKEMLFRLTGKNYLFPRKQPYCDAIEQALISSDYMSPGSGYSPSPQSLKSSSSSKKNSPKASPPKKKTVAKPLTVKIINQRTSPKSPTRPISPPKRTSPKIIKGTYMNKQGAKDGTFRIKQKGGFGRDCKSFTVPELKEILFRISGVSKEYRLKNDYCKEIETELKQRELIE